MILGIDPTWLAPATPILLGAGVGLLARRVIAETERKRRVGRR